MHEEIVDNKDKHRKILMIPFLSKKIILNQSLAGQEKCAASDGRSSWPFEFESPTYAPTTFEVTHIFHQNHPLLNIRS
jgi:hypothetical protein